MNPLLLLALLMGMRGQGQQNPLAGLLQRLQGIPQSVGQAFAGGIQRPEPQLPPLTGLVAQGDPWATATAQARAESAARNLRIQSLMDELNAPTGLFGRNAPESPFLVPAPRRPFYDAI